MCRSPWASRSAMGRRRERRARRNNFDENCGLGGMGPLGPEIHVEHASKGRMAALDIAAL
jgi:hypothetical protein